ATMPALSGAQPQAAQAQAQTPAAPSPSIQQTPSGVAAVSPASPTRHVVATYFHNTVRCVTCRTIEQRARETIESAFAAELASGRLVWQVLNMEKKEYEHYATDYNLTSPSLVLALVEGDRVVRFAVLKDTWTLVRKKAEFEAYVVAETLAFLEEL
ncbi:MAG: nitrophenyl compound nitroreductase subunit ArsF family protein, partial [Candidatus Bipolaricaulis sp.]|nr:nitrophenyl compound nitroreductase subunit ArsF family protein [Candidatus Bipolaricaulis sp.]